ncbi:MAG: helix-turn-helix domain-containing protein [Fusobacterium periodonticum]|jgi:toxin-antitoxin system, antitoxin component, xre family|nr:helix-turn-helix domain-containing protein [Fusobacterium periodonticum]
MKGKCSDRIKEALNLRNMKPIELVEQSNIKKSALSQYMSGKITPRQKALDAMAKVLNVSPAWLMGFDVPMEREGILNDAKIQETHDTYLKTELKGEFTITENINDEYIRILNVENEKANETIYNLKRNEYASKIIDKIKISFSLNDVNYTDDDVYKFIKLFKEYKKLSDDKQKEIDSIIYGKNELTKSIDSFNLFELKKKTKNKKILSKSFYKLSTVSDNTKFTKYINPFNIIKDMRTYIVYIPEDECLDTENFLRENLPEATVEKVADNNLSLHSD